MQLDISYINVIIVKASTDGGTEAEAVFISITWRRVAQGGGSEAAQCSASEYSLKNGLIMPRNEKMKE